MTPAPAEVAAVLQAAVDLIEARGKCNDWFARNLDGQVVDSTHPYDGAGPVCAAGAMHLAVHGYPLHQRGVTDAQHDLFDAAGDALCGWSPGLTHIATWSDAHTAAEVVAGLRGSADMARREGAWP